MTNADEFVEETTEEEALEVEEEEIEEEETPEEDDRAKRRDSQIERLKREKAELKAKLAERDEPATPPNSALIERTYLAANGYKDKDVQEEILRLAKKFDLSVDAALEDEDIKRRADSILKEKQAKASVAPSTGGARQSTRDVSYWAKRLSEKGEQAPTAEMRAQVLRHLGGK